MIWRTLRWLECLVSKDIGLAVGLFVSGSLLLCLAWRDAEMPQVLLSVEPGVIVLDGVAALSEVPFSLELSNKGRTLIDIMAIETSCTCMNATMTKYQIYPGGRESMSAVFKSGESRQAVSTSLTIVFRGAMESKLYTKNISINATVEDVSPVGKRHRIQ